MFTHDTRDTTARFLIRGYFTGDNQHWTAIWDRHLQSYVSQDPWSKQPYLFRDSKAAESWLTENAS